MFSLSESRPPGGAVRDRDERGTIADGIAGYDTRHRHTNSRNGGDPRLGSACAVRIGASVRPGRHGIHSEQGSQKRRSPPL